MKFKHLIKRVSLVLTPVFTVATIEVKSMFFKKRMQKRSLFVMS